MYKENGRLSVKISGVISDINKDTELSYIMIDGEKVYINSSSEKLFSKIDRGEYVNLECYLSGGKLFASDTRS